MYVWTESYGILNLNCFSQVNIRKPEQIEESKYALVAFSKLEEVCAELKNCIVIAEFDKEVEANYILCNLFNSLARSETTWEVSSVKSLSTLWGEVKQQVLGTIPSDVLEKLKLNISSLNEITITYPSNLESERSPYIITEEKEKIADVLIKTMDTKPHVKIKWKIKWESCPDLNK